MESSSEGFSKQFRIRRVRTHIEFPDGRRFAFSILDDTDDSTLENVKPVYDRLRHYGLRTTKTVWPLDCPEGSRLFGAADTLQRADYLAFVRELQRAGFEIASHGATMESSGRERTLRSFEFLKQELGIAPRLHANHGHNRENIYWGLERFRTKMLRRTLGLFRPRAKGAFLGESPDSSFFWGDLCQRHIAYVRNFTFAELNALRVNPEMPYRTADTSFVRYWFSTTDAPDLEAFKRLLTRARLDRLEREGGVCIVSTHLGKGFARNGRIDAEVEDLLAHLSSRQGWFVPVSEILDHILDGRPSARAMGRLALLRLELRFLVDQLLWGRRFRDSRG